MKTSHNQIRTFLLVCVITSCYSSAQNDLAAKEIDLRNSSDSSGTYEVGFCARSSPDTVKNLPGHAFVSYSYMPYKGNRTFFAIGHTVPGGTPIPPVVWSYFARPVMGYLKEENYTSAMQSCLTVKVNKADYDAAFALTSDPLSKMGFSPKYMSVVPEHKTVWEAYKLGEHDCIDFLMRVAEVLRPKGLIVPQRGAIEMPLKYIERFIASQLSSANPSSDIDVPYAPTDLIVR